MASIVLLQGMKITPLVSPWSTTTKIESNPSDSGRSVMKSIVICSKGLVEVDPIGMSPGVVGCVFGFIC